jgi:hypothetical protein
MLEPTRSRDWTMQATGAKPFMPETFKTCACGASYTEDAWEDLPLRGYMRASLEVDGAVIELRPCLACGSTLAIELAGFDEEA